MFDEMENMVEIILQHYVRQIREEGFIEDSEKCAELIKEKWPDVAIKITELNKVVKDFLKDCHYKKDLNL